MHNVHRLFAVELQKSQDKRGRKSQTTYWSQEHWFLRRYKNCRILSRVWRSSSKNQPYRKRIDSCLSILCKLKKKTLRLTWTFLLMRRNFLCTIFRASKPRMWLSLPMRRKIIQMDSTRRQWNFLMNLMTTLWRLQYGFYNTITCSKEVRVFNKIMFINVNIFQNRIIAKIKKKQSFACS